MKNNTKFTQPPFSILNILPKKLLIQTPSPSYEYELYHVANKKICIEAYKTFVPKARLFTNLEIYEWRNLTQFPISKSKYVSIQPNINQSPMQKGIELLVYIQHCPLKLNRIYEMTLAQTIYMLKESYIGFERLYNRFGPFEITESMIAINLKGYCKVWINQNYATNVILKPTLNEENMIFMIQSVMQSHCQQSKASRKLFLKLKYCKNFLSAIKEIDCFAVASKLLVPTRFVLSVSSCKQVSSRLDKFDHQDKGFKSESFSPQSIRYSIFSSNYKTNHDGKQQIIYDLQTSKTRFNKSQIKKFKSLLKINTANIMKISDGETAYTRNYNTKNSNLDGFHNSPRQTADEKTIRDLSKKKVIRKLLEDSTFIMEIEDKRNEKKQAKQKKQMSHSTSLVNKPQGYSLKRLKLSANMSNRKSENYFYKFQNQDPTKKSQHNDPNTQFALVMDDQKKDNSVSNRAIRIVQQDEQKYKQEHTQNIIKNNGWHLTNHFLSAKKQLNQSFHKGGYQQNNYLNQIKLDKLDSIGRRNVAMSVLPEQYEDII